ncbi:hypothetical protein ACROYT_G014429 [Oculina patagonica]
MYICKTGRRLSDRFGEHLRSVEGYHQHPCYQGGGFPVAKHFNLPDHNNIQDMRVSVGEFQADGVTAEQFDPSTNASPSAALTATATQQMVNDITKALANFVTDSELRVVIATVAFGMGVNCPDVSQVIHFRSPSNLLSYAQEAGSFTSEKKKILENELFLLRDSLAEDACLLSADHSLGFTTNVVKQIVENCENMKTEEDILEKVDIWNVNLAGKVLAILQNVSTN